MQMSFGAQNVHLGFARIAAFQQMPKMLFAALLVHNESCRIYLLQYVQRRNRLLARFQFCNVLWNLWIIQIDANKCCLLLERAQKRTHQMLAFDRCV